MTASRKKMNFYWPFFQIQWLERGANEASAKGIRFHYSSLTYAAIIHYSTFFNFFLSDVQPFCRDRAGG